MRNRWAAAVAIAVPALVALLLVARPLEASDQWVGPIDVLPLGGKVQVSCATVGECVAVDAVGRASHFDGVTWSAPATIDAGHALTAISCGAAGACVAVDDAGRAVEYDAGWQGPVAVTGSAALTAVSCSAATFCLAVDAAGSAYRFDGAAWSAATIVATDASLISVSCASASSCVVGTSTGSVATYDGTSFTLTVVDGPRAINAVSCPGASSCIVASDAGTVREPGAGGWGDPIAVSTSAITALACPAVGICVAVDAGGGSVTRTAGGWGTRTTVNVDESDPALASITCPSTSRCVAGTSEGAVLVLAPNAPPSCTDATVDAIAGQAVDLPLACTDGDADNLAREILSAPAIGTLEAIDQAAATVRFTPAAAGTATLAFRATDGQAVAPAATITINIAHAPVALTLRQATSVGTLRSCGATTDTACPQAKGTATWWRGDATPAAMVAGDVVTLRYYLRNRTGWAYQLSRTTTVAAGGGYATYTPAGMLAPGLWLVQARTVQGADTAAAASPPRFVRVNPGPALTYGYSIGVMGLRPSAATMARFRSIVHSTLNDQRGWGLNGRVRFRPVSRGRFKVVLASPAAVSRFPPCSAFWSCRSGHYVLINSQRWFFATPVYPGQQRLHDYRYLVINHEVGHALGFGHSGCPRAGAKAPVMQQQSKALNGCVANPWPLPSERGSFARRIGVRLPAAAPQLTVGRSASDVHLGMSPAEVAAELGDPQRRTAITGGRVDTYLWYRVAVTYRSGVVTAIRTWSPRDRTRTGVGVGSTLAAALAVPGASCAPSGTGTACRVADAHQPGDATPTTFVLRNGRVAWVTLEWVR